MPREFWRPIPTILVCQGPNNSDCDFVPNWNAIPGDRQQRVFDDFKPQQPDGQWKFWRDHITAEQIADGLDPPGQCCLDFVLATPAAWFWPQDQHETHYMCKYDILLPGA